MKNLGKESGMGLLQVLLATGLAGGVGLIVTQLMSNLNKGIKHAENNNEVLTIVQGVQRTLATPANCTQTFIGRNPKNSQNVVTAIKDNSSGTFQDNYKTIALDPQIKYGQVRINSYSLTDAGPNVEIDTLRTTELLINFDKGSNGLTKDATKKVPLKVEIDGTGNILSCVALTNAKDNIWEYSANNIDIFFNGGNVGIGIEAPEAKLHVSGGDVFLTDQVINNYSSARSSLTLRTDNITAASDSGIRLYDGNTLGHLHMGNAGLSYFQSYGTGSIPPGSLGTSTLDYDDVANFTNLALNPLGGNIGIGTTAPGTKLDVAGNIRPGSAGVTAGGVCSPEGSFAYDIGAHVPVYCSQTARWTLMGGGALTCVTRSAGVGNDATIGTQNTAYANCNGDEVVTGGSCNLQQNHYSTGSETRCVWTLHQNFTANGFSCQLVNDSEANCYVRAMGITAHARCCRK